MSKVNAAKYQAAHLAIKDGLWRVDPALGLLVGRRGRPIGAVHDSGYLVARLPKRYGFGGAHVFVHRVIWESCNGSLHPSLQVNHKNGMKTDNRVSNLEAATSSQNSQHAVDTGLRSTVGEQHHQARLTSSAVKKIYERCWAGESAAALSQEFLVARSTVNGIKHGWAWVRVTGHTREDMCIADPMRRARSPRRIGRARSVVDIA